MVVLKPTKFGTKFCKMRCLRERWSKNYDAVEMDASFTAVPLITAIVARAFVDLPTPVKVIVRFGVFVINIPSPYISVAA